VEWTLRRRVNGLLGGCLYVRATTVFIDVPADGDQEAQIYRGECKAPSPDTPVSVWTEAWWSTF